MFTTEFFRRSIITIVSCWIIFQASFCSKAGSTSSYPCPAFSDPIYDAWFPYLRGQIIRFKNATGAENTITIDYMEKTPDYTYYATGGSCVPKVSVSSAQSTPSSIPFMLEYEITSSRNFFISLKNIVIRAKNLTDTGVTVFPIKFSNTQYFDNITLNGTSYSNVQMITRDTITDKGADIYKVFIAKKIGLLAYEEFPSLALWIKH